MAALIGAIVPAVVGKVLGSGLVSPEDGQELMYAVSQGVQEGMPQNVGGMLPFKVGGGPVGGRRRAKRKPSAYNKFVGAQMKKGATMKQAAAAWKRKRGGRGGALLGGALLGGKKGKNATSNYDSRVRQLAFAKQANIIDPYLQAWADSEMTKTQRNKEAADFKFGDYKKRLKKQQTLMNKEASLRMQAIDEAHKEGDFGRAQALMKSFGETQTASYKLSGIPEEIGKKYPALAEFYA